MVLKTDIAVPLNNRYMAWLSNSAMVCYNSNINYEALPFCKTHAVYILATNTSAYSVRTLFETISLTYLKKWPVVFNLTFFIIAADACNKHSMLLTIPNSSQFRATYTPVAVFAFKRLRPQPQQVFQPWLIKALGC